MQKQYVAMKIGFVVNDVETEEAAYTTTRLAMTAVNLGHKSYTFGVGDFVYAADGSIHAHARTASGKSYKSLEKFLKRAAVRRQASPSASASTSSTCCCLRNDPSTDATERPWAQSAGILFGQLVASRGVMVLNDPENLAHAINKTYFQHFPEEVRPKTCISRNVDEIKQFIEEQHDKVVIKPLQGSGGKNVFLVGEDERANLNQMIDAVIRDGYCVAQEYLPAAAEGRRAAVRDERPAADARRQIRRLPPRQQDAATPAATCTPAAKASRSKSPTRCCGWWKSCGPSW